MDEYSTESGQNTRTDFAFSFALILIFTDNDAGDDSGMKGGAGLFTHEDVAYGTRVSISKDMVNAPAVEYLSSLLGKQLRIHTTDTRMFVGEMKCTDGECNVILSRAHEYRAPPASAVRSAASEIDADASNTQKTVRVNMTSRFLGLVVVPGEFITKIELEEYQDVEQRNDPS